MKRVLVCSMAAAVCFTFAGVATAGSQDLAKVAVHLQPHNLNTKLVSCDIMSDPTCLADSETSALNTAGNLFTGYDAYIAVVDGNATAGVGGATFGIQYPDGGGAGTGVQQFGYTLCANLEFSGNGWPASQGGNVITFDTINNCQNGIDPTDTEGNQGVAVLCFFYLYAYDPGSFEITKRNYVGTPDFQIADCTAASSDPLFPLFAGRIDFGGGAGYSPCVTPIVPVEEATWGSIKKQFGGE